MSDGYPQRFGAYVLERFLAAGGMAEVFVASRPDGRVPGAIALKRMLPQMMENPEYAAMFRDEANLARRLVHPNIVRVYDAGEYDGRLFMAMEFVDGIDASTLQKKLRAQQQVLSVPHAVRIGVELCLGLAHAHAATDDNGVRLMLIHRDVSPQNILISREGAVKVADFGVAKATGRETHTATGSVKGKIPYMAPEQALAQAIDHRVDQFAAGIIVWELLTGQRLFSDKSDLLMFEKIIRRPTPKPSSIRTGIPAAVDHAVLRALSKNPDERFPDVGAFGRALRAALDQIGGDDASVLASIVEHVCPRNGEPSTTAATQAWSPPSHGSQSGSQSASRPSQPTGVPIPAASLNEERAPDPRPVPQPAPARRTGLSVAPMGSFASSPSSPALTLDRPQRKPAIESAQRSPMLVVPTTTATGMTERQGASVPTAALVLALVLGSVCGFAGGRATAPAAATSSTSSGCARTSTAPADVEAAYELLMQAQIFIESGDFTAATLKASEAQTRSGTPKGHFLLGRMRLKAGDVASGLTHLRCVIELGPSSDEAKYVAALLSSVK